MPADSILTMPDTDAVVMEIDFQITQLTLRNSHLRALDPGVAQDQDVALIFGHMSMQASTIEQAQHRQWYRLVGRNHDLQVLARPERKKKKKKKKKKEGRKK